MSDIEWLVRNASKVRASQNYTEKHENAVIITPSGRSVPGKFSDESTNVLYDLREPETLPIIVELAAPVLALEVNDDDQALDLSWTLPDTYDSLFLERSEDGITFAALVTLGGSLAIYADADVTVGVLSHPRAARRNIFSLLQYSER